MAEIEPTRDELLQQLAALRAEVAALTPGQPQAVESLRRSEQALADFFENGPVALHWVGPDGTILRANRAELELLGYAPEEYVGRHIADFHADPPVIQDILARLGRGETLHGYEARLRCKDGSIRHVLISSNVCWQGGQFDHTRCFTRDITDRKRVEEALRATSRRATDILESITDAFVALDEDWRITYVNRETARLNGTTPAQIVGRTHWDVWPFSVGTQVEREYRRAVAERVPVHLEFYYEPLHLWLDLHAYPAGGGLAIYFRDITEKKRAEQTLRTAEERLALAVESAGLGTYHCELPLGRLDWNVRCKAHFFLPPDADVDIDLFFARLHPEDRDKTREALERAERERVPYDTQYRTVNPDDGSVKFIRAIGRYYYDASGGAYRIDGVTLDVTEQMRRVEEREELLKREHLARMEAEAASKAKDHFLAVLSHELRTPLTPVLATVSYVEARTDLPEELRSEIGSIRRNVEMEARLIDDLLDLTRISRGKIELHQEAVDAHSVLRHCLENYQDQIKAKRLEVSLNLWAKHQLVWADPARLQQVFTNLLSNAVKFTSAGGRIALKTHNDEQGRLVAEVADTGVGIEAEALPRLFNAFEQGEWTVTRTFGGLGLGLAISRAIVDMHKGSLTAASQGKNKGATFTLRLDIVSVPVPPELKPLANLPGSGPPSEDLRILLVEDHADTLRVMARLLRSFGYVVKTAATVKSALALSEGEEFDLLVSDIGLPDGSGLDIMRQVKAQYRLKGIALSGFGQDEDFLRSREAGFEQHLTKPVNFQQLKQVIQRVAS